MSTLFVDTINEKTSGNGIAIPGHVVQVVKVDVEHYTINFGRSSYADTGLQYHAEVQQQFNLNNCFSKRLNCVCKFI